MLTNLKAWGRNKPGGGRYYVQNEVCYLLNRLQKPNEEVFNLLWKSVTQGKGDALDSKGTHADGYCVDFSFKIVPWDREKAMKVYRALKPFFALAFRAAGEVSPGAHLHIALKAHANADAIIAANQGDRRVINRVHSIFTA
jgi:hypothetical protein